MIIYNIDGTERYVKDEHAELVHLNSNDFIRIENTVGGVNLYYKDSKKIFISNAHTIDGACLEFI